MEYIVYNFSSSTATQLTIPLILSASRSSWFCCVKGFSRMGFDTVAIRPRLPAKEVPFIPTFATNTPLNVVVGAHRGTALQAGRSRVRFPMVSLEFFIDIILPAAL